MQGFMRFRMVGRFAKWLVGQSTGINPATTVDVELLAPDGKLVLDADGKVVITDDRVFGLAGGQWFGLADGSIFGVIS